MTSPSPRRAPSRRPEGGLRRHRLVRLHRLGRQRRDGYLDGQHHHRITHLVRQEQRDSRRHRPLGRPVRHVGGGRRRGQRHRVTSPTSTRATARRPASLAASRSSPTRSSSVSRWTSSSAPARLRPVRLRIARQSPARSLSLRQPHGGTLTSPALAGAQRSQARLLVAPTSPTCNLGGASCGVALTGAAAGTFNLHELHDQHDWWDWPPRQHLRSPRRSTSAPA